MLPQATRRQIIELISGTTAKFRAYEAEWVERERARERNPDEAINVATVRKLIQLQNYWENAEKEIFELETLIRSREEIEQKTTRKTRKQ